MKPAKPLTILKPVLFAILFAANISLQVNAQCTSATQSISYNVLLSGNGNNTWGFVFPQFNPSLGTLVAVDIKSTVSVNINFQLQNTGTTQDTYSLSSSRDENISVSALGSPITNSFSQNEGPYTLQQGDDTVGAGTNASPQFFPLLSAYTINDSITSSVAGFLGTGFVVFDNSPHTNVSVISGSNYSLNSSFSDTMRISVVYYYCEANILPQDIIDFSVTKEPGLYAKLQWATVHEQQDRAYEIEESDNGKYFDSIASVKSVINDNGSGSYIYNYAIVSGKEGILYFRLKETNADGYTKYSEVRSIDLRNNQRTYVFPNPASNFINIVFNETSSRGWQLSIFSADGSLVQKNNLVNTSVGHVDFLHRLAKGVYFARVLNIETQQISILEFVVK